MSDVLIAGAGAAGLCAARTLTRAGRSVVILEARRRIGGRIHTLEDPLSPVPVELGAEFIHGRPPEIWRAVEAGGFPALEMPAEHVSLEGGRQAPLDWDSVDRLLSGLADAPEQTFREHLDHAAPPEDIRRAALSYVEGFHAAHAERISVRAIAIENAAGENGRTYRPAHGYGAMARRLWDSADESLREIHFDCAVESVRWRRGHVEMAARTAAGPRRFEAPRAIVTVPLGVLQSGAIRFDPEPAILREACAGIEMGHAIRLVLRFRRPLWEDAEPLRDAGFAHTGSAFMPTWWTTLPVRSPVITGWTGGPAAERAPADPRDWVEGALHSLGRMLGAEPATLARELVTWHAHHWSADPWARGAYSYVRSGGVPAQQRFAEPVEDTLYFAGEATRAEGDSGTVHGAMASGERAAQRIVYD